jgi:glucose dehydrogenase
MTRNYAKMIKKRFYDEGEWCLYSKDEFGSLWIPISMIIEDALWQLQIACRIQRQDYSGGFGWLKRIVEEGE